MTKIEIVWLAETKPDWSSKLIMRSMKKPYSHVALVGTSLMGIRYIAHAVDRGVCYELFDEYLKTHTLKFSCTVNLNCSPEELQGFVRGERGKTYSDTQLILIALKLGWLPMLRNGDSKRICSEFVAAVLREFCTDFKMPEDLDLVTPADLEKILKPLAA